MNKGHDKGHKGQMSDRAAMKLALEALESAADNECNFHDYKHAAEAIRQALEQEPWDATDMAHRTGGLSMEQDEIVPSYYSGVTGDYSGVTGDYMEPPSWTPVEIGVDVTPEGTHVVGMYVLMPQAVRHVFYSQFHPAPKREWIWLTDEEIVVCGGMDGADNWVFEFANAIQIKLREKNGG